MAIFITGKPVPRIILWVLCPAATQGDIFPVKPRLPGERGPAFVFYTADTGRMGAKPFHHAKSSVYLI